VSYRSACGTQTSVFFSNFRASTKSQRSNSRLSNRSEAPLLNSNACPSIYGVRTVAAMAIHAFNTNQRHHDVIDVVLREQHVRSFVKQEHAQGLKGACYRLALNQRVCVRDHKQQRLDPFVRDYRRNILLIARLQSEKSQPWAATTNRNHYEWSRTYKTQKCPDSRQPYSSVHVP